MHMFQTKFSCIRIIAIGLSILQFISIPLEVTASNVASYSTKSYDMDNDTNGDIQPVSISLNYDSIEINRGDSAPLTASVYGQNETIIDTKLSWTSDDSSIVSVDKDGLLSANSAGTTTVYASVGELSASCDITVVIPLIGITFEDTTLTLKKGESQQLSVLLNPSDATEYDTIVWESTDTDVATVDQDGYITAVDAGTASITATCGSYVATCTIYVIIPIESISITDTIRELKINQEFTLHTTILPANNASDSTLNWSSSNDNILSVDSNGKIIARKPGTATITVKTYNNLQDNITITVLNTEQKTGWQILNEKKYYYDDNGDMQTGWLYLDSNWYYFDSNGSMHVGWLFLNSYWYYLKDDGSMAIGWLDIGNSRYYFAPGGDMQTGWLHLDSNWYYLDSSGFMHVGWLFLNSYWYYLKDDGSMAIGWLDVGNLRYYFAPGGDMQTGGWLHLDSNWYYLNYGGNMQTGWLQLGSIWYYFGDDGSMTTGWLCLNSNWYYLNSSGHMQTGWLHLDSNWYYLNYGGNMQTGWLQLGSIWYYFGDDGSMTTGWKYIDNIWYHFNESGALQFSSLTEPFTYYNGSLFNVTNCYASIIDETSVSITLEANRDSILEELDYEFYILTLNSSGTKILGANIGNITIDETFKISADIKSQDSFRDLSMNKYAIALRYSNDSPYEVLSNIIYITNIEDFASTEKDYYWGYYEYSENKKISSKKGIQGTDKAYTEDLQVQHVLLNVDIQDLIWINPYPGYKPYTYKGNTYYFSDLNALKKTIRDLHGWGDPDNNGNDYGENHNRSVTLVLLLSWKYDELSYLIHPSARSRGSAPYYSLNMQEETARETYEALFCYLGEELGQKKERVTNWTLGNEVNSCNAWNYSGTLSFNDYVSNYAQAFQLLNQGIKRVAKSPRLFVSLDHCWNTADAGYTGKQFLNQFAYYMHQTAPNIQWNVNYHPYSQPLTNSAFWNDSSNTQNNVNTPYISMNNIQVLNNYLSSIEKEYGLKNESIRVILGEMGFSGTGGNASSEKYQAAALGYGYYIAMFNTRIDSYIIRAYIDDSTETASGLYLGLRRNDKAQTAKTAYSVYKYLDTEDSLSYMNQYLNLIGISSWESVIPGFDSSKLPAIDF